MLYPVFFYQELRRMLEQKEHGGCRKTAVIVINVVHIKVFAGRASTAN